MTKKELRAAALAGRAALSESVRHGNDERIRCLLFETDAWKQAGIILIYLSYGTEVDTWEIVRSALLLDKRVYCPKIVDKSACRMEFMRLTDPTLTAPGIRGIREPVSEEVFKEEPDDPALMILPGVAFSRDLQRIGYGGGYYDRYLERHDLNNRFALCYDCQMIDDERISFPTEAHDRGMLCIITESGVITRRGGSKTWIT